MDINSDGKVTKDEFTKTCLEDKTLMDLLTPSSVLVYLSVNLTWLTDIKDTSNHVTPVKKKFIQITAELGLHQASSYEIETRPKYNRNDCYFGEQFVWPKQSVFPVNPH